jgi:hypothetical protein
VPGIVHVVSIVGYGAITTKLNGPLKLDFPVTTAAAQSRSNIGSLSIIIALYICSKNEGAEITNARWRGPRLILPMGKAKDLGLILRMWMVLFLLDLLIVSILGSDDPN